jgi:hypothetical protein
MWKVANPAAAVANIAKCQLDHDDTLAIIHALEMRVGRCPTKFKEHMLGVYPA